MARWLDSTSVCHSVHVNHRLRNEGKMQTEGKNADCRLFSVHVNHRLRIEGKMQTEGKNADCRLFSN